MGRSKVRKDPESIDAQVGARVEADAKRAELGCVAELLIEQRDEILTRWLESTRQLPFHASKATTAVADHIPQLFDALVAFLYRSAPPAVDPVAPLEDARVRRAAQAHARDRFDQGLAPADVLAEFRILRQEIGRALRSHSARAGDTAAAELLVHDALDGATSLGLAALESHEAERHRLAAHLAAIVESSSDAILAKTLDGVITDWNPAAESLYGYTAQEVVGKNVSTLIPPDRPNELPSILERVSRGERVLPYETVRVRKGGRRVDVSVTISPIRDINGEVIGASAIARDITEKKRIAEALAESEERFRMLADNISQLAWMADATGWIFWYNRRWFEFTGTTLEEMQGWGWRKAHHPQYVEGVVKRLKRSFATGEPWEDVFPLRGTDGEYRWFLSRAQPIRNSAGNVVRWFGTNTDITELRNTEEALRRSEEQRQALLSAIAHDLRNPLTTIKGMTQLLGRQAAAGDLNIERLVQRLDAVRVAVDRMDEQIQELNLLRPHEESEGEAAQLEPIDLMRLVREAAIARQLASELHTVRIDSEVDELIGTVDATGFARVLDNLLANAVKYSPRGGEILLTVRSDGDWVSISVRDEGLGVPASDIPFVFEPLRRGSNVGSIDGSGIGLAAARGIVEGHGGSIQVESREGFGSTFTVRLPRLAERKRTT